MWGGRRRLGHEKEVVCIVSGVGCMWGDRRAWDTRIRLYVLWMRMWGDRGWVAENKVVCIVRRMCIWGDRRRLGHEKEDVCIVSGGCMWGDRRRLGSGE